VAHVEPGCLQLDEGQHILCDLAVDARGLGARGDARSLGAHGDARDLSARDDAPALRGVRGELVWLHAPGVHLRHPVRLLHPRHRVYIVPRAGQHIVVGASEIESEDRSPVSLRSAVELMAAAHSVLPGLAEARIVHLDTNLRPAWPDHQPRIEAAPGLLRITGLYRHGWLLAPALVDDALKQVLPEHAHA
jgi:glycine oxidase